jgi:predicted DNA-binding protein (MmcQ/YjbR family)
MIHLLKELIDDSYQLVVSKLSKKQRSEIEDI